MTGVTGPLGVTGNAGETGVIGATGAQGIQGVSGVQGVQGNVGAQGLQGATGAQGVQGLNGGYMFKITVSSSAFSVANTSVTSSTVVVITPASDPGSGVRYWVTTSEGVGYTINLSSFSSNIVFYVSIPNY